MNRGLVFLLVLAAAPASAQEKAKPTEPIVTDRPDFTESALVVPRGWLQLESGLTYRSARGAHDLSGPEALFRYGLRSNLELRLGLSDYNVARVEGHRSTGFGDTYVGAKLQVGPWRGIDLSLIPAVFLPDGSDGYSSGGVDPELKLCASRDLGGPWSLSGMAYGAYSGDRFAFQSTLSLGRELTRRLSAFLEYAGTFSRAERPEQVLHMGLALRSGANAQFDVHAGVGDGRPFVAGGYAVRL